MASVTPTAGVANEEEEIGKIGKMSSSSLAQRFFVPFAGETMVPSSKRFQLRVAKIINAHDELKEIAGKHKWFVHTLAEVCRDRMVFSKYTIPVVRSPLSLITAEEASNMGQGFAGVMVQTMSTADVAIDAVESWINKYPALVELDSEFSFFRKIMEAFGAEYFKRVPWGLKLRVFIGAVLSISDLASDIIMISIYTSRGQRFFANIVAICVGSNVFFQTFLAYVNYPGVPWKVRLFECAVSLTGSKPILDAYRVSSGVEKREGCLISCFMDMAITRACELFFECIPLTLVQVYVLLDRRNSGDEFGFVEIGSLSMSALTTGFITAIVTFDFDTKRDNRKDGPEFYGAIRSSAMDKLISFVAMWIMNTCTLLLRALSTCLLIWVDLNAFLLIFWIDLAAFLFVKLVRKDIWYYRSYQSYSMRVYDAFTSRIVCKVICDFTGVFQLRHPQEMGGAGYTLNAVIGLVISFLSTWLYDAEIGVSYWSEIMTLLGIWLLSTMVFLCHINHQHLSTFYSTMTTLVWNERRVLKLVGKIEGIKGADIHAILYLVQQNPLLLQGVENEIQDFFAENWKRWEEDKADFFVPQIINSLPPNYTAKVPQRDPSSFQKASMRSRRESIRKANKLILETLRVDKSMEDYGRNVGRRISQYHNSQKNKGENMAASFSKIQESEQEIDSTVQRRMTQ